MDKETKMRDGAPTSAQWLRDSDPLQITLPLCLKIFWGPQEMSVELARVITRYGRWTHNHGAR